MIDKILCYLFFILFVILILGCQNEVIEPNPFGKYALYEIISDNPVDLNSDGIFNNDLKKELDIFSKTAFYLYDGVHPSFDLIWPEIYLNDKPININSIELSNDSMDIDYKTISIQYYISFIEEMKYMKLEQPLTHSQSISSIVIPMTMNIVVDKGIIHFSTYHKFYSNDDILNLPVSIKFKKILDYN